MNWVSGFGFGVSIGSMLMTVGLTLERKRTREALVGLVERGFFRLETQGGQPARGADLVAALDTALRQRNTWAGQYRKPLTIVAFFVALVLGAVTVFLVRR